MKKLLLLLAAGAVISSANAQTPEEKNVSMIGKMTATWCPPCGAWGWTLYEDVIATGGANAFPISYYSSSSSSWDNTDFYNSTAVDFAGVIGGSGYPTFSVNFFDHSKANTSGGSVNTAGVKSDVNAAVASFASGTVVAGIGMTYKITGNNIEVMTKTKFYGAATGTYKLAVYLVEAGALHSQASQTGDVPHKNVLRASLAATTWGDQIATGSIAKDAEFDKTFTFTVTDASWDKTKLKPIAILFKSNGVSGNEYVNGTAKVTPPASVGEISKVQNVAIYPNPAVNNTTISFDNVNSTTANIVVVDATGRTVYTASNLNVTAGRFFHDINTSSFASGMYNVTIQTDNAVSTTRFSVAK